MLGVMRPNLLRMTRKEAEPLPRVASTTEARVAELKAEDARLLARVLQLEAEGAKPAHEGDPGNSRGARAAALLDGRKQDAAVGFARNAANELADLLEQRGDMA